NRPSSHGGVRTGTQPLFAIRNSPTITPSPISERITVAVAMNRSQRITAPNVLRDQRSLGGAARPRRPSSRSCPEEAHPPPALGMEPRELARPVPDVPVRRSGGSHRRGSAYCASFGFSLSSLPRNLSPSVAPPAFGEA